MAYGHLCWPEAWQGRGSVENGSAWREPRKWHPLLLPGVLVSNSRNSRGTLRVGNHFVRIRERSANHLGLRDAGARQGRVGEKYVYAISTNEACCQVAAGLPNCNGKTGPK